jgi:hypothetical protein
MTVIDHGMRGVSVLTALLLAGGIAAAPGRSASPRSVRNDRSAAARRARRIAAPRLQGRRGAYASRPLGSKEGLLRLLESDAAFRKRLA